MAASKEGPSTETWADDPPARATVAEAPKERLPRSVATLGGALVFLLGAGVVVAAFDPGLARESQALLFWSGLAVSIAAATAVGLRPSARESDRMLALAGLGALLYMPYVLRSPEHAIFGEHLYHQQVLRLAAESGHTDVPVARLGLSGQFPGLELAAAWLHDVTGMSIGALARLLPLVLHVTAPMLVFGIATAIGLSGRTAFLAGMLYMGQKAFFFLHSAFSPEALGIVFFLGVWVLVATAGRGGASTRAWAVPIVLLLAGGAVTQHLGALMTGLSLLLLAGVLSWRNERTAVDAFLFAATAIVLLNAWLFLHATKTIEYFSALFIGRIGSLVDTLRLEGDGIREIFGQQTLPFLERALGYVYPSLVLVLSAGGIYLVQRSGRRRLGALLVTFMVVGPILWLFTMPAVLAGESALAFRLWPFLFVGMAIYAAVGLRHIERFRALPPIVRRGAVAVVVATVIAGGIVVGDNEAGRFPTSAPTTAAGPESVSGDAIAAARWLALTTGRNHRFIADKGSGLVFATFGNQRAVTRGNWLPFAVTTPRQMAERLKDRRAPYVVVDQRIARFPPRYGYVFSPEERVRTDHRDPLPAERLRMIDQVRTRSRIYDNGVVSIYGPAAKAG